MQSFRLILFPVIVAFSRAADPTILEMLFGFLDDDNNGVWEINIIKEVEVILGTYAPVTFGNSFSQESNINGDLNVTLEEFKKFHVAILEGIFKLNDPNGDGFITSVELLSGDILAESNSGLLASIFKLLDLNKDGFLSREDVLTRYQIVNLLDDNNDGVIDMPSAAPEQLVKLYNVIDKNTDDKFTLDEIEEFLTTCGAIMDGNSDGIITREEQLHAFTEAGLTQAQAQAGIAKFQMSRTSDMVNNIIAILDMDNDEQVSQAEVTRLLDDPFNSPNPKIIQLILLAHQTAQPNDFQLDTDSKLSEQQALEALGRFLDNPRFN